MTTPSTASPFATDHSGKQVPAMDKFGTKGELYGATITVGAEAGSTINVVIQLTDFLGIDLAIAASLIAYLSADSGGQSVGSTTSSETSIGSDGFLNVLTTKQVWRLTCEIDGDIDLDIVDTNTNTNYLILVMPNGTLVASDAITHT